MTVAENGAVIAFDDRLDDLARGHLVSFILASVMKNLLKVELPDVSLVVDDSELLILVLFEGDGACGRINFDIF